MKFSECELGKMERQNESRFGVKITFNWLHTYEEVKSKQLFNAQFCFNGYIRCEQYSDIDKVIDEARRNGCVRCKVTTF